MRSYLKKHWPLLGLGVLLALVAFYLVKAGKRDHAASLLSGIASKEGVELNDIHYTQDDPDKRLKWVLDAKRVRLTKDQRFVRFSTFDLMVEPEEKAWVRLKGDEGDYSRDSGLIEIRGHIEGETADGYKIRTEKLLVDEKKGTVQTELPVELTGPFFSVSGKGLLFDFNKETVRIPADVTTQIR